MKLTSFGSLTITVATLLLIPLSSAFAAPAVPASSMTDAVTHDQLVLKLRAAGPNDPMRTMKPAKGPDPSKVNQPESLLATSDIVCFGGAAVLVPKRAILRTPAKLAERLKLQPGAQLQSWADFYAANRGWITTVEVSRTQAEGNAPLEPLVQERISKSNNLIVATYQTGPISVLPLKVPEPSNPNLPKS